MIAAIGTRSKQGLHRQRHSMAAARQPARPTPQETQICLPFIQRQIELVKPGRAGHARQSLHANLAVDPRGHHEDPWAVGSNTIPDNAAVIHAARDLPSGLSVALAVLQAPGMGRDLRSIAKMLSDAPVILRLRGAEGVTVANSPSRGPPEPSKDAIRKDVIASPPGRPFEARKERRTSG